MDLTRPFSRPYRVRFDEAGMNGCARAGSLVRYLQDVAWQHSEAAGFDRAWYAGRGLGWLVRGIELELLATASYGEVLSVSTRITGWRRMWARRHSEILAADGRPIAAATIDWVLLDAAGRPVRIPAELEAVAPGVAPFPPTRVDHDRAPSDAISLRSMVRAADLDPMGHLNNAAYLDLLEEAVTATTGTSLGPGATVRLEYLRPALPGMALESLAWPAGDGLAYRLVAAVGSTDLLRAAVRRSPGAVS